ncbi:high mobility group box domain-containing protein [Spinellus fusiger]|nr:high mobility group box domain-containing protein [Spinellus fusiger]
MCSPGSRHRSGNPRKKKQKHIPRPMNCFLVYRFLKQKELVRYCPGINHCDISRVIAKWWHNTTQEDKKVYRHMTANEKKEHSRRYPNYKYTPRKKMHERKAKSKATQTTPLASQGSGDCLYGESQPVDICLSQHLSQQCVHGSYSLSYDNLPDVSQGTTTTMTTLDIPWTPSFLSPAEWKTDSMETPGTWSLSDYSFDFTSLPFTNTNDFGLKTQLNL